MMPGTLLADDRSILRIIQAVQLAPSVYNTQPWSFWVCADNRIELRPHMAWEHDGRPWLDRLLPYTDEAARELRISCGAALFNLRMAIRVAGHEVEASLLPDPRDEWLLASVEIMTGRIRLPRVEEQELYDAIQRRHTCRWPFTRHRVPDSVLAEMATAAAKEKGYLEVLNRSQVRKWLRAAAQAEDELTGDQQYVTELSQWTIGARPGLGVPSVSYGPPPASPKRPVRNFGPSSRPPEQFESHAQLLLLATDYNRPLDWLRAGQALQRALLTATHYGVAASFLTQPLEFAIKRQLADSRRTGRRRLPDSLRLPGRIQLANDRHNSRRWPNGSPFEKVPQMLIRVGYPDRDGPQTPREDAPQVIDLRSGARRPVLPSARPHQIGP
jgi:nitroreductase